MRLATSPAPSTRPKPGTAIVANAAAASAPTVAPVAAPATVPSAAFFCRAKSGVPSVSPWLRVTISILSIENPAR